MKLKSDAAKLYAVSSSVVTDESDASGAMFVTGPVITVTVAVSFPSSTPIAPLGLGLTVRVKISTESAGNAGIVTRGESAAASSKATVVPVGAVVSSQS